MKQEEGAPHPIIRDPHEYRIVALGYEIPDGEESFLDLTLARGEVRRRLRFWSPRDLEIEKGFPIPTRGMQVLDVSGSQLEGIGIRVRDFEASSGSITFWAREVEDLDAPAH